MRRDINAIHERAQLNCYMDNLLLYNISSYTQGFGSLVISAICLMGYSKRPTYIKVLGFYGLNSFIFQLMQWVSIFFFYNQQLNTIGNVYVLFENIILSYLFYSVIQARAFRNAIIISILFYMLIYIFVFLMFPKSSYSIIRSVRDLQMVVFCMLFFFYLLRELPEYDLMQVPMFWVNSALLIFFSGTFILSYFRDYIVAMMGDGIGNYWIFRNFFRFTFCLVLAYAGWLNLQSIRAQKSGLSH